MRHLDHSECGCSHEAFSAIAHIDAIVSKATMIPEASRLSALEKRLYDVSMKEFERRAKPAAAKLIKAIESGRAKDEESTLLLMSIFDKAFEDLPAKLAPFYETAAEEAYRAGFEAAWKKAIGVYPRDRDITYPSPHRFDRPSDDYLEREKAEVGDVLATMKPSFNVVDENAIATLKNHQVFWIGHHYDAVLSNTIANSVVDSMVKTGFDRAEGAKLVQSDLKKILDPRPGAFTTEAIVPHGWSGSVAQYYEGLAANTMTVSRTFGALSALRRLGAQTYTISNPMDDRTCEVCAFLAGTSFATEDGAAAMDAALATKNPELVKRIIRWDGLKTIKDRTGLSSAGPRASAADAKSLSKSGYGMPPFHFRCYDDETEVLTSIGFLSFNELDGSEKVMTVDLDTLSPEYQPIKRIIKQKHSGSMVHIKAANFDLMVTPDHDIVAAKRWGYRTTGEKSYGLIRADEIPPECFIPRRLGWTGKHIDKINIGGFEMDGDLFVIFMAWYLSEGNVTLRSGRRAEVKISQSNREKRELIVDDLADLKPRIGKDAFYFYFPQAFGSYLAIFGKAHEKWIPEEIMSTSRDQIDLFLDRCCLGDGHHYPPNVWDGQVFRGYRSFTTSSRVMASHLGELMLKIGRTPSYFMDGKKGKVSHFRNGIYQSNHDTYRVNENSGKDFIVRKSQVEEIEYDGFAYCVEVEKYNTLIVRRNGKVCISGNCRCVVDIGEDATFGVPVDIDLPDKPDPLRFPGDVSKMTLLPKRLDGAHTKYVLADSKGDEWMFKPYHKGEEYRAYGDVAAGRVAQAIGHNTPEVYVTEYQGKFGSIQKMYPGVKGNYRGANLATLSKEEIRAIQKEHAFDWLISNHDGHAGNLLALQDGRAVGIDKGQLFKFFPDDKLAWTYNPNQIHGEVSIYNKLLSQYSAGELGELRLLDLRDKELRGFFDAVSKLDDQAYASLLKPYSSARAAVNPAFDEARFLAKAIERKNNLSKDMSAVWKEATKKKNAILGKAKPKKSDIVTPLDAKFVKDVEASGARGKSLIVDSDAIRDGNVLVYSYGKQAVAIECRLTSTGDDIVRLFGTEGAFAPKEIPELVQLRQELDDIAAKIANRFGTAPVPQGLQAESFAAVQEALQKIRAAESKWNFTDALGRPALSDYKAQVRTWWNPSTKSFNGNNLKAKFGISNYEKQAVSKGVLSFEPQKALPLDLSSGTIKITPSGVAREYTGLKLELGSKPGEMTLRYVPHGVDKFSYQGTLTVMMNKSIDDLKPGDIQKVFDVLGERGMKVGLADKKALEYQMLKSYFDRYQPGNTIIGNVNAPLDQKLKALREAANAIAKAPIKIKPSYTWGEYGWIKWERFDISTATKKKLKEKYVLTHDLWSGDPKTFLRKLLDTKIPGFISTEEKYRVGIVPQGMSPGSDQGTGGARMIFTRIRAANKAPIRRGTLIFEADEGLSSMAYSYKGDQFGDIHPYAIQTHSPEPSKLARSWGTFSKSVNNETIIENGLDIGQLKTVYVPHGEVDETIGILKQLEEEGLTKFVNPPETIVKGF